MSCGAFLEQEKKINWFQYINGWLPLFLGIKYL